MHFSFIRELYKQPVIELSRHVALYQRSGTCGSRARCGSLQETAIGSLARRQIVADSLQSIKNQRIPQEGFPDIPLVLSSVIIHADWPS